MVTQPDLSTALISPSSLALTVTRFNNNNNNNQVHGMSSICCFGDDNISNNDDGDDDDDHRNFRKQKASDRRTRRMQRGGVDPPVAIDLERAVGSLTKKNNNNYDSVDMTLTVSPMQQAGQWNQKRITSSGSNSVSTSNSNRNSFPPTMAAAAAAAVSTTRGRSRSRSLKRSQLYSSLATYQDKFLRLLTDEYRVEVRNESIINVTEKYSDRSKSNNFRRIRTYNLCCITLITCLPAYLNRKRKLWEGSRRH